LVVATSSSAVPDLSTSERAKRNALLQALHRRGTSSRLQLARELRISNSRVCDLIDGMVAEGLLREEQVGEQRRGRRGVGVRLNPKHGHLLGFDMEAKRLRLVVTDFAGTVVWQTRKAIRPARDRDGFVDQIVGFLKAAMAELKPQFGKLMGIGLAASGVIDVRRGMILHYDLVPAAANLPLRDVVHDALRLPCVMENNIRAMTLAEWVSGAAKGLRTFVCIAVRSGVGAGIVLDGRLIAGSHGFCGETGYMVIPSNAPAAQWKSLQQTVSETAMGLDVEADGFDEISKSAARRSGEILGSQIASIATVLDPEAIVLAGGILNPEGPVWPHVLRTYSKTALSELVKHVPILPAQLGPFAAAQGAAYRCLYELFPVAASATR
jgi:predicted NBD/HSP70 family sugar kinase